MVIDKKKLYIVVVSLLSVLLIAVAVVGFFALSGNLLNSKNNNVSKETANSLKSQAIESLKANNVSKAKKLFQQANEQYKTLNDKNNVIDTEAQIYIIEHSVQKQ